MPLNFQPPDAIIQQYLTRPSGYQQGSEQIGEGLQAYANYKLKQQQLAAEQQKNLGPILQGYSAYADSVGPNRAQNDIGAVLKPYGINMQSSTQTQQPPTSPGSQISGTDGGGDRNGAYHAGEPWVGRVNDAGGPQGSSQAQPQPQQKAQQPQGPSSEHIANSMQLHGVPDFSQMANQLNQQYQQGNIGRKQLQMGFDNIKVGMEQANQNRQADQFQQGQNQQERHFQQTQGMETKKTIAGEVSKQGPSNQQIGQIRGLYNSLDTALKSNTPTLGANLSGFINQHSGGRYGSSTASDVLNAANPLATALNTELSHRFNSGEVQILSNSLIPNPADTPAYAQKKMARLNQMISAMESGNDNNVRNVAAAITGGMPRPLSTQSQGSPQAYQGAPQIGTHFNGRRIMKVEKVQ